MPLDTRENSYVPADDGLWSDHPGLGIVRSGPRGKRYWEHEQGTQDQTRSDYPDPTAFSLSSTIDERPYPSLPTTPRDENHPDTRLISSASAPDDSWLFVPKHDDSPDTKRGVLRDDANPPTPIRDASILEKKIPKFPSDSEPIRKGESKLILKSSPASPNLGGFTRRKCVCPIDKPCPAKKNNLYDCRSLVKEHQKWMVSQSKLIKHWLDSPIVSL